MKERIKYLLFALLCIEVSIFLIATLPFLIFLLIGSSTVSLNEFIFEIFPLFYYNGSIFGITSWLFHVIIFLSCIFAILIPKIKRNV